MSVIRVCDGCGKSYTARKNISYGFCRNCKAPAQLERLRRYRARQKDVAAPLEKAVERKVTQLTVVSDPLIPGGFSPGTKFNKDDWHQMLRLFTFTPGTTLRDGQGRLYVFRLGRSRV